MTYINLRSSRKVSGAIIAPNPELIISSATGGSESTITQNGKTYRVHTFTSTGNFIASSTCEVDYLIVAGGGGGGGHGGGGGGGGGVIVASKKILTPGTYVATVGAGASRQGDGGNSSFNGETAIGGGAGCYYSVHAARSGGCGGGATFILSVSNGQAGAGTLGQGFRGGDVRWTNSGGHSSGGGGGAGGMGYETKDQDTDSGWGGPGRYCDIDGNAYYYGGGGGAGSHYTRGGDGGVGGGGGGAASTVTSGSGGGSSRNNGTSGATGSFGGNGGANTGGGGGGGHGNGNNGGLGGSGLVIVRYRIY